MPKTDINDIRQSILAQVAAHDPARPATEFIAASDDNVRELLDPRDVDADRSRFAQQEKARRERHTERTQELLATRGQQAIIDAWVSDSPNHTQARRNWAEGEGRKAVLTHAARDESQRSR